MKRYLTGLIGLAFIGASSLIGQALAFGGESSPRKRLATLVAVAAAIAATITAATAVRGVAAGWSPSAIRRARQKKETVHKYCCTVQRHLHSGHHPHR